MNAESQEKNLEENDKNTLKKHESGHFFDLFLVDFLLIAGFSRGFKKT